MSLPLHTLASSRRSSTLVLGSIVALGNPSKLGLSCSCHLLLTDENQSLLLTALQFNVSASMGL